MSPHPDTLTLSIALSDNERTRPILEGRFHPQGVRFIPTAIHPSEMFWRQLKYGDFDVSEMSLSTLCIAVSRGDRRWVALPIFTARKHFHTSILVREDSGIREPRDLHGRRVGVPEYQQTWAVWSRGILQDDFGVDARKIDWFMERGPERSHGANTGFQPPPGVRLTAIAPTTNIGEMMARGELDATLLYLRSGNLVDRSSVDLETLPGIRTLFADPLAEGRRFHAHSGIYPINHTVVIRRELLERHPWLALNIYHAFVQAQRHLQTQTDDMLHDHVATGLLSIDAAQKVRQDPKPYGVHASRAVLTRLTRYVHEQGLTDRCVDIEELFAPSTLEL
jgi:4,5-dihydroxyphthalate decarboxylase